MSWEEFLWSMVGVILTLCTFSFLYKDNPFYKIAEHLVVGVSAGYFVILLWYNGLKPTLFLRLEQGHYWYIIPAILGVLMWFRFSKNLSWISRYPIAFYIGIATGIAIPAEMKARVNEQLFNTMIAPDFSVSFWTGFSEVLIIIGVIASLFYFFFSKAHRGVFGGIAKIGIYILMIGFGASFGYTVMARISLFIQRIQIIRDWINMAQEGGGGFLTVMWIVALAVVLFIIMEIIKHIKNKTPEAA